MKIERNQIEQFLLYTRVNIQTRAEPRGVQEQAFRNVKYPSTMQNVGM